MPNELRTGPLEETNIFTNIFSSFLFSSSLEANQIEPLSFTIINFLSSKTALIPINITAWFYNLAIKKIRDPCGNHGWWFITISKFCFLWMEDGQKWDKFTYL